MITALMINRLRKPDMKHYTCWSTTPAFIIYYAYTYICPMHMWCPNNKPLLLNSTDARHISFYKFWSTGSTLNATSFTGMAKYEKWYNLHFSSDIPDIKIKLIDTYSVHTLSNIQSLCTEEKTLSPGLQLTQKHLH